MTRIPRRHLLGMIPAAAAAQRGKKQPAVAPPPTPAEQVRSLFVSIVEGYRRNALKTSPSLAVVEYPNATITKNFLTSSGLSATGVTRMLPALASWVAGGHGSDEDLRLVRDALVNGCNPDHADFWQLSRPAASDQRQVESSIVAWSLWLLRDRLLPAMSAADRANIAAWLASCTRVPVRNNNWAWFTAVNSAVRLRLAERWPEFSADQAPMIEDLTVLDSMATGDSGWYNDGFKGAAYDYYNSWVFASHFLYWNAVIGECLPGWRSRFAARLGRYLETAPYFFAGHGGHVLYGRSLIYRWGVLTPLILAYQQGLWPHSPGLLRHIVERNILWHASIGAFDQAAGKLRETFTPDGSPAIKESYIDGGHPYWGMQAFAFFTIPATDPFWTAPAEPLPVEKSDYAIALPEPGLLLAGTRSSGQVRLFNARSYRADLHYRDKYNKLVYSSHFPFAVSHEKGKDTIDNTLALRNPATGVTATRGEITASSVEAEKIEIEYAIELGAVRVKVHTEVQFVGEFESRMHSLEAAGGPLEGLEVVEGGAPYSPAAATKDTHLKTWNLRGWKESRTEDATGSVFYASHKVQTLVAPLEQKLALASLRYQSPKAMPKDKVDEQAKTLLARLRI
ncbi:MAG: DUF2264 domain-containing protein [Candidatus Solibacter usitatus]|nr:DUF2264 domain-containing protein [Candidatus Solibacter usitatus]